MEFKKITLIYPEPLTEHQEKILTVNIKAVKDKAVQEFQKQVQSRMIPMYLRQRFETLAEIAENGIRLSRAKDENGKIIPAVYHLIVPITDLTGFERELNSLGIKGVDKVLPVNRLIDFIRGPVAKDMGIHSDSVVWEQEDI